MLKLKRSDNSSIQLDEKKLFLSIIQANYLDIRRRRKDMTLMWIK